MIPFAQPLAQYRAHKGAIDTAIARVLDSGGYIMGREVDDFERAFASYCGAAQAIGVGSGTDALTLTLKALGIGAGDEVVTVSHTAIATVAAVLAAGALPVLADIDPVFYTLDPASLARAFTARTKAVIAVHLYGQPVDLDAVAAVTARAGIPLIEDCAQAAGADWHGRKLGSVGHVGCFSFFPTKNLGAIGDGGMVVTSDAALAQRLVRIRQYGWDAARHTDTIGVNSRLDPLQAAILAAKLPHLDADNARRAALAARYHAGLAGLPLTLPAARANARHAYHLYVVACDDRDTLKADLAAAGIDAGIHYPLPAHRHGGYAARVRVAPGGLPVTEALAGRILSLPLYPELADAEADRVIAAVRAHYGR